MAGRPDACAVVAPLSSGLWARYLDTRPPPVSTEATWFVSLPKTAPGETAPVAGLDEIVSAAENAGWASPTAPVTSCATPASPIARGRDRPRGRSQAQAGPPLHLFDPASILHLGADWLADEYRAPPRPSRPRRSWGWPGWSALMPAVFEPDESRRAKPRNGTWGEIGVRTHPRWRPP